MLLLLKNKQVFEPKSNYQILTLGPGMFSVPKHNYH